MASADRRPPARPGRLKVVVATPDSAAGASRGLSSWLQRAAPRSAKGEVTVALVSDRRMRTLNRAFRGRDYATDVLSFPAADLAPGIPPVRFLGDVVIATGVARRQAVEAGHPEATEIRLLALHGLLHLLGYDHERDSGQMARLERRLRRAAGLREGTVERAGSRGNPRRA